MYANRLQSLTLPWPTVGAITLLAAALYMPTIVSAASPVYWCPDRKSDQQYASKPGPGCVPLVEKEPPGDTNSYRPQRETREFKIDNLQQNVAAFLGRYQQFLDCCKTDLSHLYEVQAMGDEVAALLKSVQDNLSNHSMASRGIMLKEMIPTVAKARSDLGRLRATLERIADTNYLHGSGSLEESGRAAREIRELEDSIERDIRAPKLSTGPKTGAGIGAAPSVGPSIGKTPKTGNAIGAEGTTGMDIGASSRNSGDIGGSGPTGFDIGATGRAGPSIGESGFNSESSSAVGSSLRPSTVGSSLSDSTVGSSFGGSSVGSSLQDSNVGSSFGGSSVGSSLQNR